MAEYTIPTTAIVSYTEHDWRYERVLCREPGSGELLIRMLATGICHTDIANVGEITPRILGHEGAGRVLRKGPDCTINVDVDDPVLLSFAHCKECQLCLTGHPAHCEDARPLTIYAQDLNFALADEDAQDPRLEDDGNGRGRVIKAGYFGHSSFSAIALVKESSVVNVKDLVANDEELMMFAPLGCGIQTGACSVINVIRPSPEDSVGVFGLGGVGLSAIMAAKALGVREIIAVDILPNRLSLASSVGATHTINSKDMSKEELTCAIRSLPPFQQGKAGPSGPSAIVDTTAVPSLIQAALAAVRRMGRVVQLANKGPGSFLTVGLAQHMGSGVHLTGTIQGDADPAKSIPLLIQWYREGKLPLERLEKRFAVEDFDKAREEMHSGVTIKPVLVWPQQR